MNLILIFFPGLQALEASIWPQFSQLAFALRSLTLLREFFLEATLCSNTPLRVSML